MWRAEYDLARGKFCVDRVSGGESAGYVPYTLDTQVHDMCYDDWAEPSICCVAFGVWDYEYMYLAVCWII